MSEEVRGIRGSEESGEVRVKWWNQGSGQRVGVEGVGGANEVSVVNGVDELGEVWGVGGRVNDGVRGWEI